VTDERLNLERIKSYYTTSAASVNWTFTDPWDVLVEVPALVEEIERLRGVMPRPIEWRWLASTRVLQREAFGDDVWPKEGEALATSVIENVTSLVAELSEMLHEVGWKPWATPRGWINRDAFVGELVDVGHFLANLLVAAGVTDAEWEARYRMKQAVNLERQRRGYDGVSGKCPRCGRSYDDPGVSCFPSDRKVVGWCQAYGNLEDPT
jgi:hypothetical protein